MRLVGEEAVFDPRGKDDRDGKLRVLSNNSAPLEMRAVTLKGFIELASSLEIDGYAVLRAAKLQPRDLEDPEKRYPAKSVIKVLEKAAEQSRCSTFGLRMATKRSFEDLGAISLLMQHLPNLLEVIIASSRLRRHYNDLLLADVSFGSGQSFIRWDLQTDEDADQACDLGLGLAYHLFKGASKGRWEPTKVHVSHAAAGDTSDWQRMFRCPIEFCSFANGFSCSTRSLEAPSPLANPVLARHASALLQFVEPMNAGGSYKEQVCRLLRLMIPHGRATLIDVAKHLDINSRTLQRYLSAENSTFEELLEEEKLAYVFSRLANRTLSLGMISEALGYSSPSAFSRWFSNKTGKSPSAWRKQNAGNLEGLPPPTWRP